VKSIAKNLLTVITNFRIEGTPVKAFPLGSGHINATFLVHTEPQDAPDYVLQWINHKVFRDIPGLMNNIVIVTYYIRGQLERFRIDSSLCGTEHALQVLQLAPALDGNYYYQDPEGNFWRLYHYIPGSYSYDRVPGPKFAYEGGRAYGTFQQLTAGLNPGLLHVTIPRFHDITWRMEQFEEAIRSNSMKRADQVHPEIEFIRSRADEMHTIHRLMDAGQLPVRTTHNDTKFNNILFDGQNRAICIVDLDTVMPGTVLYDFGDAIRTGANSAEEDESDLDRVDLDLGLFEAYTHGFLEAAGSILIPAERSNLAFSARFMTYIIGLRFLTDHLEGDIYYRIQFPGHNLQRARVQFRLLEKMEGKKNEMEGMVRKIKEK
jgi:hypothetical protein